MQRQRKRRVPSDLSATLAAQTQDLPTREVSHDDHHRRSDILRYRHPQ